jgi:hypothetical protein
MTEKQEKNKKVNKVILSVFGGLIALMVLIAVVGGGSDSSTPASAAKSSVSDTSGVPVSPPTNSKPLESDSEKAVALYVRTKPDLPKGMTQAQVYNNAKVVCKRLNAGDSPKAVRADEVDLHGKRAGDAIYEAATDLLCPRAGG